MARQNARWSRNGLDLYGKRLENIHGNVRKSIIEDTTFIAEQGAQEMQGYIEERGTTYSRYRAEILSRGTSGRHDTGEMVDAVGYRVTSYPTRVNAEVGWLEDYQKRFAFQEKGTAYIEAMYALRDASSTMRERFRTAGPGIIEKALRKN